MAGNPDQGGGGAAIYSFVGILLAIGIAGLAALVFRQPLLFPSLGPSAYLALETPTDAAASPRNALIGHGVALLVAFAALQLFALGNHPSALVEGMTVNRLLSVVLALAVTSAILVLLDAMHPPAGATSLLVTLGLLKGVCKLGQRKPMRKLIYGINVTLDGCCDHTKGIANDEVHEYFTEFMREVDTIVYGRKTYQLMVPFWPDTAKNRSGPTKAVNEFAQAFDSVERIVVFSRSLQSAPDGTKTRILRGNVKDEILKLKQEEGKSISTGGVDIPSQLIELGLVDEYRFVVHPIIAGEGRRLLESIQLKLKLADSKTFASGHVALRYLND